MHQLLRQLARLFGLARGRRRPAPRRDLADDITNDVFNPAAGRRLGRPGR